MAQIVDTVVGLPESRLGNQRRPSTSTVGNEVNKSGALRVVYTGINIKVWWPHAYIHTIIHA